MNNNQHNSHEASPPHNIEIDLTEPPEFRPKKESEFEYVEPPKTYSSARKIAAILMIILGSIMLVVGIVNTQYVDQSNLSRMEAHAYEISQIRSVGGKTMDEAFYEYFGYYLTGQAQTMMLNAKAVNQILILGSAMSILTGICLLGHSKESVSKH